LQPATIRTARRAGERRELASRLKTIILGAWRKRLLLKTVGLTLVLNYSIRNKSSTPWPSPLLEFYLKRGGKIVLSGNDLLPNVQSGQELQRSTSFFLTSQPQETIKFDLDVS
jgi:hypothetical protein